MADHDPVFDLLEVDGVKDHVGQLVEGALGVNTLALAERVAVTAEVVAGRA